ncbi:MAG: hypothetical protein AAFR71_07970 [Pseudomonadota bacterium]
MTSLSYTDSLCAQPNARNARNTDEPINPPPITATCLAIAGSMVGTWKSAIVAVSYIIILLKSIAIYSSDLRVRTRHKPTGHPSVSILALS